MSTRGKEILERAEREHPEFVWRLEGDTNHMIGHPVVDGQGTAEREVALSGARLRAAERAERQRRLDLVGEGYDLWKAQHPDVLAPSEHELIMLALIDRWKRDQQTKKEGEPCPAVPTS